METQTSAKLMELSSQPSLLHRHPDSSLQPHWQLTQVGVLLLPFSTLLGCLCFGVTAIVIWTKYANQLVQQLVNQILLMLGAWMVIIALFAYDRPTALLGLVNFLPFFIVFTAQSYLIQSIAQLRHLAQLLVLTSIPVIVIGLGQLYLGWDGHVEILWVLVDWLIQKGGTPPGRMASVFFYATVLASYLCVTFTLSLGLWLEQVQSHFPGKSSTGKSSIGLDYHWLWLAVTLLNGVALFLTNSRNAWGILLLVCLVFAIDRGWRWLVGIVSGVTGTIAAAAYAPDPINQPFRSIVPRLIWARLNDQLYLDRPIPDQRSTQWQFAWKMIEQRPWTGWGLRNFSALYSESWNFYIGHPHNLPLMLMAEMGVPATLIFIGAIGWVMVAGVRTWRSAMEEDDRLILLTFLVTFMGCTLFCLLDIPLFDARINAMNWLILAAIWGVGQSRWRSVTR
ncbi:MAG: O-antigen ligase family protein [Synechococcales bacterium]|nr:O-antigen ligase family protein [Synechococcales bacterium]